MLAPCWTASTSAAEVSSGNAAGFPPSPRCAISIGTEQVEEVAPLAPAEAEEPGDRLANGGAPADRLAEALGELWCPGWRFTAAFGEPVAFGVPEPHPAVPATSAAISAVASQSRLVARRLPERLLRTALPPSRPAIAALRASRVITDA
jgi:hypothetical protein